MVWFLPSWLDVELSSSYFFKDVGGAIGVWWFSLSFFCACVIIAGFFFCIGVDYWCWAWLLSTDLVFPFPFWVYHRFPRPFYCVWLYVFTMFWVWWPVVPSLLCIDYVDVLSIHTGYIGDWCLRSVFARDGFLIVLTLVIFFLLVPGCITLRIALC